jgi:dihydroxyacetone kinase-like predicted kinase
VPGKDLFSRGQLDSSSRAVAVLGVVTLGFEDDVEGAIKALQKIMDSGLPAERAEEIIEASRTIKSDGVELTPHAKVQMNDPERLIDKSEINDAIDRGTHFWDTEH